MKQEKHGNYIKSIIFALLAAALYAMSSPLSKLLLSEIPFAMMAALLYLGAGAGMGAVSAVTRRRGGGERLTSRDLPYVLAMIALDIAAPILFMLGLERSTAANVSLLNNLEIVATSLFALLLFKERISKRLWLAIALVSCASALLCLEDKGSLDFSAGSLFVVLACLCWGFENNCTKRLSERDPLQVVVVKGFGSGLVSLAIAFMLGETGFEYSYIPAALLLGFFSYGLSIFFYVRAQRVLGAAKTSAFYAIAPFIGAFLSLLIFKTAPSPLFLAALAVMAAGSYFAVTDGMREPLRK